jgi:hypothetical protein
MIPIRPVLQVPERIPVRPSAIFCHTATVNYPWGAMGGDGERFGGNGGPIWVDPLDFTITHSGKT